MLIPKKDSIFFAQALRSMPKDILFGEINFDLGGIAPPKTGEEISAYRDAMARAGGVYRSELVFRRKEGKFGVEFSLDPLEGLAQATRLIHKPRWATVTALFSPPEYASSDFQMWRSVQGGESEIDRLLLDGYHLRNAQFYFGSGKDAIQAILRAREIAYKQGRIELAIPAGVELIIPPGKEDLPQARELLSWYEERAES